MPSQILGGIEVFEAAPSLQGATTTRSPWMRSA